MDTKQMSDEEFNSISTQMMRGKYVITADSPEYIRNCYELVELSLILEQTDIIEYTSEEVLLMHPELMDKALDKGYIINPKSPECIKKDKYLIEFLSNRIYKEGNKTDLYVVSCLQDITKLNNYNSFLYKFINCATKEQITPNILNLFLRGSLSIASIENRLWKIIINDRKLIDVILKSYIDNNYYNDIYMLDAFFPRNVLNNTTEENLDYVLNYFMTKYQKDFGNISLFKYKLQYLKSKNKDIFKNLKFALLCDEFSFLGIETLNCMATDSWICSEVLTLKRDGCRALDVLEIILCIYDDQSVSIKELIYLLVDNGLNTGSYDELFDDIDYLYKIDFKTQKEIINNLVSVLINSPYNDYQIKYFKELSDAELLKKRKDFFDRNVATKRFCFLKKYNLSLAMINSVVKRYNNTCYETTSLKYLPNNLREIITDIGSMYYGLDDEDDYDKITEVYNNTEVKPIDINISVFLEQHIRNEYIKAFDTKLYRPNEEERLHAFDTLDVSVYEVNTEFNILAHMLHPYYDDIYDEDIYQDWNRPYNKQHGICCCYITNQNMSTPNSDKLLVGFSHLEDNSVLLMAPYDMHSINTSYASTYETHGCFFFPNDLINNTRDMHSEVTIERRNLINGTTYKRQPDYFIYKTEVDSESELTPEIINDSIWDNTVEAAKKFNVPIVIINETKILKSEQQVIISMLLQITNDQAYELIPDLIVRFVNNIYSCQCCKNSKDIIFNKKGLDELINHLISIIEFYIYSKDYDSAIKIKDLLIEALLVETKKIMLGRKVFVSMFTFEQYIAEINRLFKEISQTTVDNSKKKTY